MTTISSLEQTNSCFGGYLVNEESQYTDPLSKLQCLSGAEYQTLTKSEIKDIIGKSVIPAEFDPTQIRNNLNQNSEVIKNASEKYKIDPTLLKAIIIEESGGKVDAMSGTGAMGIMQLTKWISASPNYGTPINPFNPQQAIDRGAQHLADLNKKYGGDVEKVSAAYNQGEPMVDSTIRDAKNETIPGKTDWKDYFVNEEGVKYMKDVTNILDLTDKRAGGKQSVFFLSNVHKIV